MENACLFLIDTVKKLSSTTEKKANIVDGNIEANRCTLSHNTNIRNPYPKQNKILPRMFNIPPNRINIYLESNRYLKKCL